MKEPIWKPPAERINSSNMKQFIRIVNEQYEKNFAEYEDLYNWSVENIEDFWKAIWDYSNIRHLQTFDKVLTEYKMPGTEWFTNSKINFAENLLRKQNDDIAIISCRENYKPIYITYGQLNKLTAKTANALKKLGVTKGDRVAGYVSNTPEAVIAMLATVSIGAIWSSCSPDFGIIGVLDRFEQIEPKVLFSSEAYSYNGRIFFNDEKINEIETRLPSLKASIRIPLNNDVNNVLNQESDLEESTFNALLNDESEELEFEYSDFSHPIYIMYSSGTTGKPKCIVHSAGGTFLQHYKELSLHTDLKESDSIFYFTTCGWMMWNWLVSSLSLGARIVLYDGNPTYPSINYLWDLIDEHQISIFGTSPKFISLCEKSAIKPSVSNKLTSLKTILSTGSPLTENNFAWIYENVKKDILLSSISGGTDIISCFMLGNPMLPVYKGEIQCRGLGMKVEAFDAFGKSITNEKGELVCTKPFPSMPIYFWNDKDGAKYLTAYFNHYDGVWRHGDFIEITGNGSIKVFGRSDATLNPGGVRIGTSEIYRIVEAIDEVKESLVIGVNISDDVKIVLFVVLRDEINLTDELINKIKRIIKSEATPRHVPHFIFEVKEIPHTISGKKVETTISKIFNGIEIDNLESIANPNSLNEFRLLKENLFLK